MCFLDDEFCFVGTGEDEFAHSPREMREYLKRDVQEITEPFGVELTLFQEQEIGTDMRNLSVGMLLRSTQYHWRVRGFLLLFVSAALGVCGHYGLQSPETANGVRNITPGHWW